MKQNAIKKIISLSLLICLICSNAFANIDDTNITINYKDAYIVENVGSNKIFHIINNDTDCYDENNFEIIDEEVSIGEEKIIIDNNELINISSISECILKNEGYVRPYEGILDKYSEKKLLSIMPHYDTIFYTSADLIRYELEDLKGVQGILKELLFKASSSNLKFKENTGFSTDILRANYIELSYLISHYDSDLHNKYLNTKQIKRSKLENEIYKQDKKYLFWYKDIDELYGENKSSGKISLEEITKKYYGDRVYDEVRLLRKNLRVMAISPLIDDFYYNVLVRGYGTTAPINTLSKGQLAIPTEIIKQIEKGDIVRVHRIKNVKTFVDFKSYSKDWKNEYKDFTLMEIRKVSQTPDYREVTVDEQFKSIEDYENYIKNLNIKEYQYMDYIFDSKNENGVDETWTIQDNFTALNNIKDTQGKNYLTFTPVYSLKVLKNARVHLHQNYTDYDDYENKSGYERGAYWFCGPMTLENIDNIDDRKFSYYIYDHINNFDNDLINDGKDFDDEGVYLYYSIGKYVHQFNVSKINTYFDIVNNLHKNRRDMLLSLELQNYTILTKYISFDEKGFVTGIYGNR